jgi:phenylpyruvate tautomerase PptA (4-oxalocrotonate tautomerase family)
MIRRRRSCRMPFVKVYLRKGKSAEYRRAVIDGVHDALVATANVPAADRFGVVLELSHSDLIADPNYGGVTRTDDLVVIEIVLNAGRTVEIKKNLFAAIAENLSRSPGVIPDDVLVSLVEVTKENWSFGKGIATYA